MSLKLKIPFYIFLFCIVFLGIYLRIVAMTSGFDIFYDEATLIFNIENKKTIELFGKLDFSQCCPPLFLIISKFVSHSNRSSSVNSPIRFARSLICFKDSSPEI